MRELTNSPETIRKYLRDTFLGKRVVKILAGRGRVEYVFEGTTSPTLIFSDLGSWVPDKTEVLGEEESK